ncbi:MAG: hypothetical protein OJF49_003567 [Ktedonobacterales bacterium]|nr:MAG: hypothetical protein OJF49_003567 [Ktedonobacterales bacterium]
MAATPRIERATPDDLDTLLSIRASLGWTRHANLLRSMLAWDGGRVFVVREGEVYPDSTTPHLPAATTAAIATGSVGVIGNVVVRPEFQRRGLAKLVMRAALDWMRERGVRAALLDATKSGHPLYASLGFRDIARSWFADTSVSAVSRDALRRLARPIAITQARPEDIGRIAALDAEAFGGDRTALLAPLARIPGAALYLAATGATVEGYLLVRPLETPKAGIRVGPWIARDTVTAAALLSAALASDAPWREFLGVVGNADAELLISPPGTNPAALNLLLDARIDLTKDDVIMQCDLALPTDEPAPAPPPPPPGRQEWIYAWTAPMVF